MIEDDDLYAAPVEVVSKDKMEFVSSTDYSKIYIRDDLTVSEHRTALRREQGRIWMQHNIRMKNIEDRQPDLWALAFELEIAINIFDVDDRLAITDPKSNLSEIPIPDAWEDFPDNVRFAHEIYEWLVENMAGFGGDEDMENPHDSQKPENSDDGEESKEDSGEQGQEEQEPVEEFDSEVLGKIAEKAREGLDGEKGAELRQEMVEFDFNELLKRRPSLVEEVDSALRVRVEREPSYRRPSRRQTGDNTIMKGTISVSRPPRVEIFVDRSYSFTAEKTRAAESKLKEVLKRYNSSVTSDVLYFANNMLSSSGNITGNTPYDVVYDYLCRSRPRLAIIITDDDPVDDIVVPIKGLKILCIPIGCESTLLAERIGGIDVDI